MTAWPVLVNAALVAFQTFLLVTFGGPVIAACFVFCVAMFAWTLVMWIQS